MGKLPPSALLNFSLVPAKMLCDGYKCVNKKLNNKNKKCQLYEQRNISNKSDLKMLTANLQSKKNDKKFCGNTRTEEDWIEIFDDVRCKPIALPGPCRFENDLQPSTRIGKPIVSKS